MVPTNIVIEIRIETACTAIALRATSALYSRKEFSVALISCVKALKDRPEVKMLKLKKEKGKGKKTEKGKKGSERTEAT